MREYSKGGGLQTLDPRLDQINEAIIHDQLKVSCQTYADRVSALIDSADSDNFREGINEAHPFLKYALHGMLYHSNVAQSKGHYQGDYLQAFPTHKWTELSNLCEKFATRRFRSTEKTYILALNGFCSLLRLLKNHSSEETWFESLNVSGEQHRSPLGAAIRSGDHRVLELLLKHGASPDSNGMNDTPCLWLATRNGDLNSVRALIGAGADVRLDFSHEKSILRAAVSSRNGEVIKAILAHPGYVIPWHRTFTGALLSSEYPDQTVLREPSLSKLSAIEKILDASALKWAPVEDTRGIMPLACRHGLLGLVQTILRQPTPFETFSGHPGCSHPFINAEVHVHHQIVNLLLECVGKRSVQSMSGISTLELASIAGAIAGKSELVKALLAKGTTSEASRYISFDWASRHGRVDELRMFLVYGVSADGRETPLCRLRPIQNACEFGYENVVELLLEYGADPNLCPGLYHHNPLQAASYKGHIKVVKVLLRHQNIDVNAVNSRCKESPLSLALEHNHVEIAQLLRERGAVDSRRTQSPDP